MIDFFLIQSLNISSWLEIDNFCLQIRSSIVVKYFRLSRGRPGFDSPLRRFLFLFFSNKQSNPCIYTYLNLIFVFLLLEMENILKILLLLFISRFIFDCNLVLCLYKVFLFCKIAHFLEFKIVNYYNVLFTIGLEFTKLNIKYF